MNLTCEHFKYGGQCLESYLLNVMNYIISSQNISSVLKEGLLTTTYKKGDRSNPVNYRGITVTPVILKILEHILSERHNKSLHKTQSKLQKGFTAGSSSMVAALILSECIYEAKNTKSTLFITILDAQKAFDAVDNKMLLRKLYLDGIRGNDWLLLQNLYHEMTSVEWKGFLSSPFVICEGVCQGGALSSTHYKRYNNPLLLQLEDKYTGTLIGSIQIPHVTVVDDLLLISDARHHQCYMMLMTAPTKTDT